VIGGFFAVVEAMGAFLTGVGVDFLGTVPGTAFLVPMGWGAMVDVCSLLGSSVMVLVQSG
jgi:hypothetical protein